MDNSKIKMSVDKKVTTKELGNRPLLRQVWSSCASESLRHCRMFATHSAGVMFLTNDLVMN
jgi:hypothetical protein